MNLEEHLKDIELEVGENDISTGTAVLTFDSE